MYFTFKDIDSRDMGVTLLKTPTIQTPNYRRYETDMPGRHGANIRVEGLTSHVITLEIVVEENRVMDVLGWLKGRGLFSHYKEPNLFIEADIQAEISIDYLADGLYHSTFNIYAHDATWFSDNTVTVSSSDMLWTHAQNMTWEEWATGITWEELTADVHNIENMGTFNSKPIMTLYKGSADIADITINETRFLYDFKGESEVVIDCENQEAYLGANKRNNRLTIGYEFPILKPGNNILYTNVDIKFERKDRWL